MRIRSSASGILMGGLLLSACVRPTTVGETSSLLTEMLDLETMAEFPDPPYTCKQFSSYDRASTTPADEKTWFANGDAGQFLRTENHDGRTEYVMMDADGPGVIVRIWSANPTGTIRIYLDGQPAPALAAPMRDLLGGNVPGIPTPIACERSHGWSCYFPIPYARHCKVTSDQGGFYYHVNYRTYPAHTQVATFDAAELEDSSPWVYLVAARLAFPRDGALHSGEVWWSRKAFDLALAPGQSAPVAELRGPRAIRELTAQIEAADVVQAARHVVLAISFDGEWTVTAPLGDFFGAAPGINAYASLPLGVSKDGAMWSHWVMPFARSARIELRNLGDDPVRLRGSVTSAPYRWTDRSMHFCAKWRTQFDVATRPMQDWNYLSVTGQGVFAGAAFTIANPVKTWWGEGDEKIYVDGETFPSHFGTGTEDYFGYAWCANTLFAHAYHGQPRCDGPGNYGHTAVNRWHIVDRIPFTRQFRFDMELWHWNETCRITPTVVAYWYARPGARDGFSPIQRSDLKLALLAKYQPARVAGASEGEQMRVIQKSGEAGPQDIDGCSNDQQLWWHGGLKPGDRLVLGFDAPSAGRRRVLARCVRAADYGTVQLSVNDEKAGATIDGFSESIAPGDEIELGVFDLTAGENRLTAEIVGANERAAKQYMFGLDYLRLESAP